MDRQAGFFRRHRDLFLSWKTIVTLITGLLLLVGFIVSLVVGSGIVQWIYLASAVIGGSPIVIVALKATLWRRDITVGLMVSVAMVAAIIVGEYVAAALVVFMMAIGELLEDFTASRANNALRDLAKLTPSSVTVRRDNREVTVCG